MDRKATFIIWAVDDFNALALLRQLGQSTNATILFLIIGKKRYAYRSKYCHNYIETESLEEGYEYLLGNFNNLNDKPVIFTSGDNVMVFMDSHKEELEKRFYVPGCTKKGDTTFYTDKYNMWAVAKKVGMSVPKCIQIKKSDVPSLTGILYPCIIKPSHETPGYYNEFKFMICKNGKKFFNTMKRVRESSVFVVQELIVCKKQLLVYGCRTKSKKVIISGSMLVDRFSETGSSSHGEIQPGLHNLIEESLIEKFLDEIDYVGLFSFEFGVFDGKAYFFEINLRNDGTSNFFFQSGSNIPLILGYDFLNLDYDGICHKSNPGIAIDDLYDYENVLKKRLSKRQWNDEYKDANYFKYYDGDDVEPYAIAKAGSKKQMRIDIFLKKHRLFIVNVLSKLGLRK